MATPSCDTIFSQEGDCSNSEKVIDILVGNEVTIEADQDSKQPDLENLPPQLVPMPKMDQMEAQVKFEINYPAPLTEQQLNILIEQGQAFVLAQSGKYQLVQLSDGRLFERALLRKPVVIKRVVRKRKPGLKLYRCIHPDCTKFKETDNRRKALSHIWKVHLKTGLTKKTRTGYTGPDAVQFLQMMEMPTDQKSKHFQKALSNVESKPDNLLVRFKTPTATTIKVPRFMVRKRLYFDDL